MTIEPNTPAANGSASELLLATFVSAIFFSAALLFAVQPMFTKIDRKSTRLNSSH